MSIMQCKGTFDVPKVRPARGRFLATLGVMASLVYASTASAAICIVPDDGTGTAELPPACTDGYLSPTDVHEIIDGLPPGTTIILDASHSRFFPTGGGPGGSLGGEIELFDSELQLTMTGTGDLTGFARTMLLSAACETHTGPRTPGDPVQSFPTEMVQLQATLPPGDPDFDFLQIVAGTGNGLPSPGHTTLTQLPSGDWNVDSFFDVSYEITFVGAPGGALDGFGGTTTGTIRMQAGEPPPPPPPDWLATPDYSPIGSSTSLIEFGGGPDVPPIPADFFGPGSDPFVGTVALRGNPIDPATMGNTDTIIQRLSDTVPAAAGDTATVEVEIVALSLVSAEPIPVTYSGGTSPELWDVDVHLSSAPTSPPGQMTILRTHANGGTFDSFFDIDYQIDFRRQSDGALRTLVPPAPLRLRHEVGHWLDGPLVPSLGVLHPPGATFFPGVSEDPATGDQTIEPFDPTSEDVPPSVIHWVEPPRKVCTYKITCVEGDCSGCPAAAFGFCEGAGCPNDTCGVLNGLTSTCGADGCCIEFGEFTCGPPTGAPPCPAIETCECTPPPPDWHVTPLNPASHVEFGAGSEVPPIPADFFDPGSDPFFGLVQLRGQPLDPANSGDTDTIVQRLSEIDLPAAGASQTVDVELIALSLSGAKPILVSYGGASSELWDLHVGLSPTGPSLGQMTVRRTHANGGTFDSFFDIDYRIDFVRQSDGSTRTLLPPAPLRVNQSDVPWVDAVDPALQVLHPAGAIFIPGVAEDPADGTQVIVPSAPTSKDFPPSVIHVVKPPQLGACCLAPDVCTQTSQSDCTGTWQGPGTICGQIGTCCLADGTCIAAYEGCCPATWFPGQCQTPQACCLGGTCQTLDPRCCQALGGVVQPAGEVCSTATEACCIPDAIGTSCQNVDPTCCDDLGGTSQGPGTSCQGDADGNLIDDACEPDPLCPLPLNNQLCASRQNTDCVSTGGANEFCIPLFIRRNALTGQIEATQCNCIESSLCGPIDASQIPGTNEYILSCQNACPNVGDLCLVHIDNVSTGQGSIDSSIVNAGETVTCQCGGPAACEPTSDGSACEPFVCPDDGTGIAQTCLPQCVTYDPLTGATVVTDCACEPDSDCHVKLQAPGAVASGGDPCVVADTGGTVLLPPPGCPYLSPEEVHEIIDGLPPTANIEFDAIHDKFITRSRTPGGNLGGEVEIFDSILVIDVRGGGDLAGFNRFLNIPVLCETHTGPRTPGDPVQSFDTEMVQLQGEIFGDPDFCVLRVRGGTNNGLPSPGHTTLTRLPSGNFNVDSFFDIEYQIEFQGCPGSVLDGMAGTTTGTINMSTGAGPTCEGSCPPGETCNEVRTVNADGTINLCCECVPEPVVCQPNATGTACEPVACPDPAQICQPRTVSATGAVLECDCIDPDACHVELDVTNNAPVCVGTCPPGQTCELFGDDVNGDGIRDTFWCDCVDPPACKPNTAGTACEPFVCPDDGTGIDQECQPKCATYDPLTGATVVVDCDCASLGECHVELPAPGAIAGGSDPCVVPDTGGTVVLPPAGCPYLSPDDVHEIIDGLPAGTTIEFDASHDKFITRASGPGGNLGGEFEIFDSFLFMDVSGTGALGGFNRILSVPVQCETHTGPRTPGDPVQSFDTEMVQLQGELFGDPDFCVLRIRGGTNNGLPSPGHTTLTQLPSGNFNVDSFFDIAYTIEFQGCPGSPLDGMAGTTTGTIRMSTGAGPTCKGDCPPGTVCEEVRSVNPDGSITLCCDCVPDVQDCGPDATGTACLPVTCPDANQICQPTVISIMGACADNGAPCQADADCGGIQCVRTTTVDVCECIDEDACHVQAPPPAEIPECVGICPPGQECALFGEDLDGDGHRDRFWCDCVDPPACKPNADGTACDPFACPVDAAGNAEKCAPKCMHFDPATGVTTVTECDCVGLDECHAEAVNVPGAIAAALDPACVVVDNGTGTVTLPPAGCPYLSPDDVHEIIAGLPAGTTLELDASHEKFQVQSVVPGGTLGGEIEQFQSILRLNVSGTGALAGMVRTLFVPVLCETHTGPRTPGDAVQDFDTEMVQLQGELFGDPDFCTFRVIGGSGNGLPSPGHTTLTRLPGGDFNVDSFFDISYRIEFQGCPGSLLDGMAGTTQGTITMSTGAGPSCVGACPPGTECVEQRTVNSDGTIDLCCSCECPVIDPPVLEPVPVDKNRFISFTPTNPGRQTALRVTLVNLPPPFEIWNGRRMWVNGPRQVTELPSSDAAIPLPAFMAGTLSCDMQCRDWTDVRVLNVYHEAVIPGARYEVVAVDCECDTAPSESSPLGLSTARHGDVVGPFNVGLGKWSGPDGSVDVATDVVSILDKFGAAATAPSKTWTDLEPACLDLKINITDAVIVLDAFAGAPYPFVPTAADPCEVPCP